MQTNSGKIIRVQCGLRGWQLRNKCCIYPMMTLRHGELGRHSICLHQGRRQQGRRISPRADDLSCGTTAEDKQVADNLLTVNPSLLRVHAHPWASRTQGQPPSRATMDLRSHSTRVQAPDNHSSFSTRQATHQGVDNAASAIMTSALQSPREVAG